MQLTIASLALTLPILLPLTLANPQLIVPAGGLHPDAAAQSTFASALSACATQDANGERICEQTAIGYNTAAAAYIQSLAADPTVSAAIASLGVGNGGPAALSAMLAAVTTAPSSLQAIASSVLGQAQNLQGAPTGRSTGAMSAGMSAGMSGSAGAAAGATSSGMAPAARQTGAVMGMAGLAVGIVGLAVGL